MEGVFWSKIWGSVSFSAWKYASFLTWKPGLMVISQQTCFCYSLAMSWLAFFLVQFPWQQGFLICKAEYCIWFEGVCIFFITEEILVHESWLGILLSPCPISPLNNRCFAHKITCKYKFLFDKNTVTCSHFWHRIRNGGKLVKAYCSGKHGKCVIFQVKSWQTGPFYMHINFCMYMFVNIVYVYKK